MLIPVDAGDGSSHLAPMLISGAVPLIFNHTGADRINWLTRAVELGQPGKQVIRQNLEIIVPLRSALMARLSVLRCGFGLVVWLGLNVNQTICPYRRPYWRPMHPSFSAAIIGTVFAFLQFTTFGMVVQAGGGCRGARQGDASAVPSAQFQHGALAVIRDGDSGHQHIGQ